MTFCSKYKKIIRFSFCDIQNNQGQAWADNPFLDLDNTGYHKTLVLSGLLPSFRPCDETLQNARFWTIKQSCVYQNTLFLDPVKIILDG